MWRGHSVAEREVLIAIWDNMGEGTRLTSATASTWGLHFTGKHFTNLPGVLWQKICHCLWLIYPLQRGASSRIPVSMRKAEGLAGYLSTAPVVDYRLINWHPDGSAEENRIEVGQAACVQMFLSFWGTDCNLTNILSTLAYSYIKALYMNLDWGSQKHLMKFKQVFFDLC